MTSRRTILKWLPAACPGGWWGLGSGSFTNDYVCTTYTYHADGRLQSETRTGGQTICY